MGEYLHLTTVEGVQYRKNPKSLGLEIKKVDAKIKSLVSAYFKGFPRLRRELYVNNGEIETKLATCEECFFTFDEIVALYKFIKSFRKVLVYGERQQYNSSPEDLLRDRATLYMGGFNRRGTNNVKKVLLTKNVKGLDHYKVWRRYEKVTSKTGKEYYKKIPKSETYGNPNGKQFPCPNQNKRFLAYPSGFAWDYKINKGRDLFTCPKCHATFNQGEFCTAKYKWLSEDLNKTVVKSEVKE